MTTKQPDKKEQMWLLVFIIFPSVFLWPSSEFFAEPGINRTLISGALGGLGAIIGFGVYCTVKGRKPIFKAIALTGLIVLCFISLMITAKSTAPKTDKVVMEAENKEATLTKTKANSLFFSVYELSSKTIAVTVNFTESDTMTIFDSVYNHVSLTDSLDYSLFTPKNCYYFDTIGEFRLLKSNKLEKEIKKHLDPEYYIYGTKGIARSKINNILFALDECRTNIFAFTIDQFDTLTYGHPIICSKELVELNYGKQYEEIETKIDQLYQDENNDYMDSVKTKIFANIDSLYFAYHDDFNWGPLPEKRKCLFPSRIIFALQKDGTIKRHWADGLDLFGIPCD